MDVLKTGLAYQKGPGNDRLQLAMAEVYAAHSNWVGMVPDSQSPKYLLHLQCPVFRCTPAQSYVWNGDHTLSGIQAAVVEHTLPVAQQQSQASRSASAAQLQMEASLTCVRALLIQGDDKQATQLAQQVNTPSSH